MEPRPRGFHILSFFFGFYVLFLYGRTITTGILSFQGPGGGVTFPMQGVSLNWFHEVFQTQAVGDIWGSFRRSIVLGLLVMFAVFNRFYPAYEDAARDQGASPWQTVLHVVLPIIAPSLPGVALFGFTVSYDEFARTLLTSGGRNTLPLEIFGMTTNVTTPVDLCAGHADHAGFFCRNRHIPAVGLDAETPPRQSGLGRRQGHGLMRIAVINPNSTVSMTEKIAAAAQNAAPEAEILAVTCHGALPSFQGPEDGAAAVPYLLAQGIKAAKDGADAAIIACFDDTGLAEARAAVRVPVPGIGEAVFHTAMLLGSTYSVVTTLAVSVPVIAGNIRDYGLSPHCRKMRASDVPVPELERDGSDARARISAEIGHAVAEDGVGAIVLGCAGMADLAAALGAAHGLPVIDGVAAASAFAAALVCIRRL